MAKRIQRLRERRNQREKGEKPLPQRANIPVAQPVVPPPKPLQRQWTAVGLSFGMVLLVLAIYGQVAQSRFTVCDDNVYVFENPMVRQGLTWEGVKWAFGEPHAGNWHPLTWISHMIDWDLFKGWEKRPDKPMQGLAPIAFDSWAGGHHLMNAIMHALSAALLFWTLRLMTRTLWCPLIVAALFALHPLRVESVAWAAERKDVLSVFFGMWTLLAYAWYAPRANMLCNDLRTGTGLLKAAFGLGVFMCLIWFFTPALLIKSSAAAIALGGLLFVFGALAWQGNPLADHAPFGSDDVVKIGLWLLAFLIVTVCYTLGLLSKSMLVSLPAVMLLMDVWPLRRLAIRMAPPAANDGMALAPRPVFALVSDFLMLVVEKLPWVALAVWISAKTVVGQDQGVAMNSLENLPMGIRIVNALISYVAYIRQSFWPTGLAAFYPHPGIIADVFDPQPRLVLDSFGRMVPAAIPYLYHVTGGQLYLFGMKVWLVEQAALAGLLLVVISVLAVVFYRRRTYLAVGWFWFVGTLIPVIGLVQVGTQARADRYTYLPSIGFFIMVVWGVKELADRWPRVRQVLMFLTPAVIGLLALVTLVHVSYWRDSYAIFNHAIEVTPCAVEIPPGLSVPPEFRDIKVTSDNYFAYNHIGIAARNEENWPEAGKAFMASVIIKPNYDFGNNNLGVYFANKKDIENAEKAFIRALSVNQRYADVHHNLGVLYLDLAVKTMDEADKTKDPVLKAKAEHLFLQSLFHHLETLKIRWDRQSDYFSLGNTLEAMYGRNVPLPPQFEDELQRRFGTASEKMTCMQWALRTYELTQRLDPEYLPVRFRLGEYFAKHNEVAKAMEQFEAVRKLAPQNPDAYAALGFLHTQRSQSLQGQTQQAELLEALRCLEQALILKPDHPVANNVLPPVATEVQKFAPQSADLLAAVGYIRWRQGQNAEAAAYCQKVLSVQSDHPLATGVLKQLQKKP